MIEITNRMRSPVQVVVRSRTKSNAFTCLNIPGRGAGKNVFLLEDELNTEYVERAEKAGLISTKYVPSTEVKGE